MRDLCDSAITKVQLQVTPTTEPSLAESAVSTRFPGCSHLELHIYKSAVDSRLAGFLITKVASVAGKCLRSIVIEIKFHAGYERPVPGEYHVDVAHVLEVVGRHVPNLQELELRCTDVRAAESNVRRLKRQRFLFVGGMTIPLPPDMPQPLPLALPPGLLPQLPPGMPPLGPMAAPQPPPGLPLLPAGMPLPIGPMHPPLLEALAGQQQHQPQLQQPLWMQLLGGQQQQQQQEQVQQLADLLNPGPLPDAANNDDDNDDDDDDGAHQPHLQPPPPRPWKQQPPDRRHLERQAALFRAVATACPRLQRLVIKLRYTGDLRGLEALAAGCPQLRELSILRDCHYDDDYMDGPEVADPLLPSSVEALVRVAKGSSSSGAGRGGGGGGGGGLQRLALTREDLTEADLRLLPPLLLGLRRDGGGGVLRLRLQEPYTQDERDIGRGSRPALELELGELPGVPGATATAAAVAAPAAAAGPEAAGRATASAGSASSGSSGSSGGWGIRRVAIGCTSRDRWLTVFLSQVAGAVLEAADGLRQRTIPELAIPNLLLLDCEEEDFERPHAATAQLLARCGRVAIGTVPMDLETRDEDEDQSGAEPALVAAAVRLLGMPQTFGLLHGHWQCRTPQAQAPETETDRRVLVHQQPRPLRGPRPAGLPPLTLDTATPEQVLREVVERLWADAVAAEEEEQQGRLAAAAAAAAVAAAVDGPVAAPQVPVGDSAALGDGGPSSAATNSHSPRKLPAHSQAAEPAATTTTTTAAATATAAAAAAHNDSGVRLHEDDDGDSCSGDFSEDEQEWAAGAPAQPTAVRNLLMLRGAFPPAPPPAYYGYYDRPAWDAWLHKALSRYLPDHAPAKQQPQQQQQQQVQQHVEHESERQQQEQMLSQADGEPSSKRMKGADGQAAAPPAAPPAQAAAGEATWGSDSNVGGGATGGGASAGGGNMSRTESPLEIACDCLDRIAPHACIPSAGVIMVSCCDDEAAAELLALLRTAGPQVPAPGGAAGGAGGGGGAAAGSGSDGATGNGADDGAADAAEAAGAVAAAAAAAAGLQAVAVAPHALRTASFSDVPGADWTLGDTVVQVLVELWEQANGMAGAAAAPGSDGLDSLGSTTAAATGTAPAWAAAEGRAALSDEEVGRLRKLLELDAGVKQLWALATGATLDSGERGGEVPPLGGGAGWVFGGGGGGGGGWGAGAGGGVWSDGSDGSDGSEDEEEDGEEGCGGEEDEEQEEGDEEDDE
ncbi:hypothetical protein HYH02_009304 [Chlamydomonas schloesseri]|uniref:Uncharacterized protein n=1 Tax=Chlamydomonas schloesseri TaxID=2026947 RepID=A0A835W9Z3_9CHLO|nr:hypothetical protein HYH02_009304 [Chlamydomonas schloesseri]|eukprot:KAG2443231.1 hypothetical protein HYH02_009304 [Chlamydomonas schloesseri]